jgi:hypothetical protein
MSVASLDAEDVTGQVKSCNLTTTIGEKLKGADRTRHDLVYIIRRFGFAENFCTPLVLKLAPKGFLSD